MILPENGPFHGFVVFVARRTATVSADTVLASVLCTSSATRPRMIFSLHLPQSHWFEGDLRQRRVASPPLHPLPRRGTTLLALRLVRRPARRLEHVTILPLDHRTAQREERLDLPPVVSPPRRRAAAAMRLLLPLDELQPWANQFSCLADLPFDQHALLPQVPLQTLLHQV